MDLEKAKGTGNLGEELVSSYFANLLQENGVQKPNTIDPGEPMTACTLKIMKGTGAELEAGLLGSFTVNEFKNSEGAAVSILLMH